MKRLLLAVTGLMFLPAFLPAATVNGHIAFVSRRGQSPLANETLVWLEPMSGRAPRKTSGHFQLLTRGKMLVPHVLAVPVGSTVDFPNDDPISHNLFSLSSPNGFDLGLYRKGSGKSHTFDSPGVVNVYCNVHPSMSAVIHVMASSYYGFADATGAFALSDVPAGKYRLVAWNEQGGRSESSIEVGSSGRVEGNVAITLDSRNYRVAQHTNKDGKAYQPSSSRDY